MKQNSHFVRRKGRKRFSQPRGSETCCQFRGDDASLDALPAPNTSAAGLLARWVKFSLIDQRKEVYAYLKGSSDAHTGSKYSQLSKESSTTLSTLQQLKLPWDWRDFSQLEVIEIFTFSFVRMTVLCGRTKKKRSVMLAWWTR